MFRSLVGSLTLGLSGCAALAAAPVAMPTGPVTIDTLGLCSVAIPFPKDTDLFVAPGGSAPATPYVQLASLSTVQFPPGVSDALSFTAAASPDGAAIPSAIELRIPIPSNPTPCYALHLLTGAQGRLDARGIAAEGAIVYSDGSEQAIKWMVGEQAWPAWAGATGRAAAVIEVGTNASGERVSASLLTVPLAPPDGRATPIMLKIKASGGLDLVLLAAGMTLPTEPPPGIRYTTQNLAPFSWPEWFQTSFLPGLPAEPGPVGIAPAGSEWTSSHLVWANGSPARLWGVNLTGDAALPVLADAAPFATHLAALGFNLVRLHNIDGESGLSNPKRGQPGESLTDADAIMRLDKFTAELGNAGVFQYVELLNQHVFSTLEGVHDPASVPGGHKWVTSFEADWETAEKNWARAVWGRVNPYSGMTYGSDPHVAIVELENENSLVAAWSGGQLERLPQVHQDNLDQLWSTWLKKRYGDDAALSAAWRGSIRPGLGKTESLDGGVRREPSQRSRTDQWPTQRAADLVQFYSELEVRHQQRLAEFVRIELGFKGPLVCNTAFGVPQADALLGACDVIDVHMYWDPPAETNAFFDSSLLRTPWAGRFLERLGSCQDGKPCTISEVGHSFPNRHGQEAPLLWASLASRQGIDAVIWSGWSHADPKADGPADPMDLEGRWTTLIQMPTAAWLYRSALIEQGGEQFTRWWSPASLARDLAEQPGLWLSELTDPASLMRQRVRSAFGAEPPPASPERRSWTRVKWSPSAAGAPLLIDTNPGFSLGLEGVIGGSGSFSPEFRVEVLDGAPDPAVSLLHLPGGSARLVIAGPTIRAGTVFRDDGFGTAVAGQGPAGLVAVHVRVYFEWPEKPLVIPLPGTTEVPKVKSGKRLGTWILEANGSGWWTLR